MTSTEFCKERIELLGLDTDMSDVQEFNTEEYLEKNFNKFELPVLIECENGVNAKVEYNPDAEFEYFTFASSCHDGTLLFVYETINRCLSNIFGVKTYNNKKKAPAKDCKIEYTIGNIVIANEYGDRFATKEKPWMKTRTTVMIPIKYDIENNA